MRVKLLCFVLIFFSLFSCQKKFNQKVWLENNNNDFTETKNPRIYMIDDIMDNQLNIGMEKQVVMKILGKPLSDTISAFLPRGVKLPDSLSVIFTRDLPEELQDKYLNLSNEWYKKNYKSAPMLTYYVGWSTIDPVFLEIRLDEENKVVDFWVKQN